MNKDLPTCRRLAASLLWPTMRLKTAGVMLFLGSFHLPHSQREDCAQVWSDTRQELHDCMQRLRHQDQSVLGCDANPDLTVPCDGTLQSVTAHCILEQFGLVRSEPTLRTWWNVKSSSKIDYILHAGPRASFLAQKVDEPIGHLLRTDAARTSVQQVWGRAPEENIEPSLTSRPSMKQSIVRKDLMTVN